MLNESILNQILTQIQEKHKINLDQIKDYPNDEYYKPYIVSDHYFDAIKDEVEEAKKESHTNNSIYLEDEL
jgi:hypothetical protein